jgi:hypothetical protein
MKMYRAGLRKAPSIHQSRFYSGEIDFWAQNYAEAVKVSETFEEMIGVIVDELYEISPPANAIRPS